MKTQQQIQDRIVYLSDHKTEDFFGFQRSDLVEFLDYRYAQPYLKEGVTEEEWSEVQEPITAENVTRLVTEYMSFAWDKANNCRGLSAMRSLEHMKTWLWVMDEDELLPKLDNYTHYGKPQLRMICEKFGIPWQSLDDGHWTNEEDAEGVKAEEVPAL